MKQLTFIVILLSTFTSLAQPTWQQRVDTKIEVTLNDKTHFLNAYEELTYTNNSPDTLRYIYMHLWPNAYKHDHTHFAKQMDEQGNTSFYYSKAKDRGYIDSLQFTINDQRADYVFTDDAPDIARIDLPAPLLPGKNIKITTPFRVKIPKVFSRMGHTGQAYYISQWFPKPAVYDLKGWHPIPYLDQGEFYSEFGSWDVSITLPANYVVMATGNCTDEQENQWLDELSKKPLTDTTNKKVNSKSPTPPSSSEMKTVHFHEDNVHDFAWFADKRWLVRKDTIVSPGNNLLVTTWAAFLPEYSRSWKHVNRYLKTTVRQYGKWVGPYQYKTIKAVLGELHAGGGMEYPTITVIDKSSASQLARVIVHEGGHNWFYGMLGSNERDHAWMDEGINSFYEQKTMQRMDSTAGNKQPKTNWNALLYYEGAATHTDQAIEETTTNFTKLNVGIDIYYKTALMLQWLESYMGKESFEAGMKNYYDTWHFHHPMPEDFEQCMQRHSDKNIHWFFNNILTTDEKIDFTITKAKVNGSNTDITIRNNTGVASPVLINAYKGQDITDSKWTEPFVHTTTLSLPGTDWSRLKVDDVIPDAKSANDVYRHGPFHRFGLAVRPFVGLNNGEKDKLFIAPALGYNQYDGIMAGLVFHDLTFPQNRFRFALAPMYAFGSKSPVGAGSVGYVWYPHNTFQQIMLQADAKSFHYNETFVNTPDRMYARYTKIAPSLTFTFKEAPTSPVTRTLLLKGYSISEQNFRFSTVDTTLKPLIETKQNSYGLIRYTHKNNRTYNPFGYAVEAHGNSDFAKLSISGNVRIDYNTKKKSLYVRAYFGKFFAINDDPAIYSRYILNSSYSGINDYLYDGTYMGRNAQSRLAAQQLSIQEGGLKIPVFNGAGRSDNWLAAINLETDLPRIPIFRLFFDAALMPNANPSIKRSGATTVQYDGGIKIALLKDVANIYIPIIMSSDFQNYLTNSYGRKNVFTRGISFTLQFENLNWLNITSPLLKNTLK